MKCIIAIFVFLSGVAFAGDTYRCGNTYTDKPCGTKVALFDDKPSCDDRVAATIRHYEVAMRLLANDYANREFELTKAYIQSSKITQSTTVIGGGAHSYSGAAGGGAISGSSSSANASSDRTRIERSFNK